MPKTTKLTEKPVIPAADAIAPNANIVMTTPDGVRLAPAEQVAELMVAGLAPETAVSQNTENLEAMQGQLVAMQDAQSSISTGIGALQQQIAAIQLTPGPKGDKGDVGAIGLQGIPGAIGPKGADGLTGPTGSTGQKGDTGAIGGVGPKGDTGSVGATGATGAAGSQGVMGAVGAKGDTGAAGPIGNIGPSGVVAATSPIIYDPATKTLTILAATQSAPGVMSAADKVRIDAAGKSAIASGTTSIPTIALGGNTNLTVTFSKALAATPTSLSYSIWGALLSSFTVTEVSRSAIGAVLNVKANALISAGGTLQVLGYLDVP